MGGNRMDLPAGPDLIAIALHCQCLEDGWTQAIRNRLDAALAATEAVIVSTPLARCLGVRSFWTSKHPL